MYENNNGKPVLSIIMPTYNREKYIRRSINSILNQTFTDWELIIVDDGSTDKSLEICNEYMQKDSRIKVFHTENFGVSHARNVGLDNSSGEWYAFIDSDDEYLPDAFETMLKYSDDVDIVISLALRKPSYLVGGLGILEPFCFSHESPALIKCFKNYCYNSPWAKMFRSCAINLRFDETMQKVEDFVFGIEAVSLASNIAYVPKITYIYYAYSDLSLSYFFYISQLYCIRKWYEKCLSCFDDKDVHSWISNYFAVNSIYFFANIAFSKKFNRLIKETIIQEQFNMNMAPHIKNMENVVLDSQYEPIWEAICTGNPAKIIDECEKQRKSFMFTDTVDNTGNINDESLDMNTSYIFFAGITIEIKYRYDLIKEKLRDYIILPTDSPEITVCAKYKRIEYSKQYRIYFDGGIIENGVEEVDALTYQIYSLLPNFDAFWFDAMVIEKDGAYYAFAANPEEDQSTCIDFLLKSLEDAHIISEGNTIIRLNSEQEKFYAYGKEGRSENCGIPLKAVYFIEHENANVIRKVSPEFVLPRLMKDNVYINEKNGEAHFKLYKKFIEQTKFYSLPYNMDIYAAKIHLKNHFKALENKKC